jgi:hypothetical protein
MQGSWWQYRQWKFNADMNGDGVVTRSDLPLCLEWLFYLPGDAAIALFGSTKLGRFFELTPGSFGSTSSAVVSAILWTLAPFAVAYLPRLFIDIDDPTSRQQRREQRRSARERRRSAERRSMRLPFRRAAPLPVQERREPYF